MPEASRTAPEAESGNGQRVYVASQQGERGGQEGEPIENGQSDDERPRHAESPDIPQAEHEHAEETDGYGHAGEQDGPSRAGQRDGERSGHRPADDLLAETAHDE